jgi:hypothetical protein
MDCRFVVEDLAAGCGWFFRQAVPAGDRGFSHSCRQSHTESRDQTPSAAHAVLTYLKLPSPSVTRLGKKQDIKLGFSMSRQSWERRRDDGRRRQGCFDLVSH